MENIKLDNVYDLDITSKRVQSVEDNERNLQNIECLIMTDLGEDVFYPEIGINWFTIMNYPTKNNIKDAIKSCLSEYEKNITIESIEFEKDEVNRRMNVELSLRIDDETANVEFEVGV